MKKTIYIVKFMYYQYNSGQADNGKYWAKREFEDFEKAKSLYEKIKLSIEKKLGEEENDDLVNTYIPYSGFFEEVKFLKSIVEEYDFDKPQIENNAFSNCPECYSTTEGYSLGCSKCSQSICSNSGEREVTKESVAMALSAKQWLNTQVQDLWEIYNRIFKLNYSLSNWSFYGDVLFLTAGYSCRGSVFEENFELKKEWLWEKDIEKILIDLKKVQDQEKNEEKRLEDLEKLESLKKQIAKIEKDHQ